MPGPPPDPSQVGFSRRQGLYRYLIGLVCLFGWAASHTGNLYWYSPYWPICFVIAAGWLFAMVWLLARIRATLDAKPHAR